MLLTSVYFGKQQDVILANLPCMFTEDNYTWALKNNSFQNHARLASTAFESLRMPKDSKILQEKEGKNVIALFKSGDGKSRFVVKGFYLNTLKRSYRFRKYAFNEAKHILQAQALHINTPEVYGLGHGYQKGMVKWTIVLMEFVDFAPMSLPFVRNQLSEVDKWRYLVRFLPSIKKLYEVGCNHIDFGAYAILLSPDNHNDDVLIDFQYASFGPKKCVNHLAFLLGYVGWSMGTNRQWVDSSMLDAWYEFVLNSLEVPYSDEIKRIIKKTELSRSSIKDRLKGYSANVISHP